MNPSGCDEKDQVISCYIQMLSLKYNVHIGFSQGIFQERGKNEDKKKKGRFFTFLNIYKELKHEEKWKNQEAFELPRRKSSVVNRDADDDGDDGDEEERRSPTPHSVATEARWMKKSKGIKSRRKLY